MLSFKRKGFTLIELLVVIAIITILVTFLVPQIGGARERARRAKCLNNLRIIGTGVALYADDKGGDYPGAGTVAFSTDVNNKDYIPDIAVFDCPSTPAAVPSGTLGTGAITQTDYKFDPNLNDSAAGDKPLGADVATNHATGAKQIVNILFAAGSVKPVDKTDTEGAAPKYNLAGLTSS